ncbi:MAG: hypothetical protein K0S79_102 [Nitrospira sp.]|jgi:phage FluMu protein Com|nr:hypothetical protein [Nitrospira sp.]
MSDFLTSGQTPGIDPLREARCPGCGKLKFKFRGRIQFLELKCRCKQLFTVVGYEVKATIT